MAKVTIEVEDTSKISDGFHCFGELYSHRMLLFITLMKSYPHISWKSKKHDDGSEYEGYFIAGMTLPTGDITYHIIDKFWNLLSNVKTLDTAPKWDGHTSDTVLQRLNSWCVSL